MKKLAKNASPPARVRILTKIGFEQAHVIQDGIHHERQYDGERMKSPSKTPRPDGKFSVNYRYRYRKGFRHLSAGESEVFKATGSVGSRQLSTGKGFVAGELKPAVKIRRRIPVTAISRQLNDTGATKKSIDLLSVDCNRATVGPKTGHGNRIISYHNPTRRPFGISDRFAEWAGQLVMDDLTKGV
jgi:hypothetical protein